MKRLDHNQRFTAIKGTERLAMAAAEREANTAVELRANETAELRMLAAEKAAALKEAQTPTSARGRAARERMQERVHDAGGTRENRHRPETSREFPVGFPKDFRKDFLSTSLGIP